MDLESVMCASAPCSTQVSSMNDPDLTRRIGAVIESARKAKGLSREDIAELCGTTYQAVSNWENGKNAPRRGNLIKIADYLSLDVNALMRGEHIGVVKETGDNPIDRLVLSGETAEQNVDLRTATDVARPFGLSLPDDIPLLGIGVGGVDADFQFNGTTTNYVRRPPGIARAVGVYAIRVVNDSMSPKFDDGDLVYVDPHRRPSIGDYVVLELKPLEEDGDGAGRAFIKRLKKRTQTKIVLEQFNPPADLEFVADQIKCLHRIIPWNELLGI